MCALKILRLHNPHIVNLIDAYFTGGMNDLVGIEQDADMGDLSLFVIEKNQISGLRLFQESDSLTLASLLIRIA